LDEVTFTSGVQEVTRIAVGGTPLRSALSAVDGDRAYLAYQTDGPLQIVGYDLAGGKKSRWTASIPARGTNPTVTWDDLIALPDGVIALGYQGGDLSHVVAGVSWSDGRTWQHAIDRNEDVTATPGMVVVTDRKGHRLLGLDPRTGTEKWSLPDPANSYSPQTIAVLGDDDASRPAEMSGAPVGGPTDGRLVQFGGERGARVIDARSGSVSRTASNIGDTDSVALAVGGRLYVASRSSGYNLVSFDLNSLGDPKEIYRPTDPNHSARALAPCGVRICLLDLSQGDSRTAQVIAVERGGGKVAWHQAVPGAEQIIGLGGGVIVRNNGSDRFTAVLGADGKDKLGGQGKNKTGVRLTAGSVLLFTGYLGTYPVDASLYGFGLRRGAPTPLGDITQIRSASCGWNTKLLVCPSDKDFGVWRFAT
jgi:outer membrane protein assembly factor BamB